MPSKPNGPLRRAQLIAPFGVGAMVVVPGGVSLMVAGLDYWYQRPVGNPAEVDLEEFELEEWRLQLLLGVDHFKLPPDFRESRRWDKDAKNVELTVPAFRFPAWHFCPDCKLLQEQPLVARGRIECSECRAKRKRRYMVQVPFIAFCALGHVQDFPWREWVHQSVTPVNHGPLRLRATGGTTLAGQTVSCDGCGKKRTLAGITTASEGVSQLSKTLASGAEFLCQGQMPWLGPGASETCSAQLKGSLRNASNVYYSQMRSSIYLPRLKDTQLQEIEAAFQNSGLRSLAKLLVELDTDDTKLVSGLRKKSGAALGAFSDKQILESVQRVIGPSSLKQAEPVNMNMEDKPDDWYITFRRDEHAILREERNEPLLKIKRGQFSDYDPSVMKKFSRILLVERLRETRVMAGFTRIFAQNELGVDVLKRMLWKNEPHPSSSWLPGYSVFGEGIYLELDEAQLQGWEQRADVVKRCQPLVKRYTGLLSNKRAGVRPIGPRFVLIHTLAHLIMNRLTFECGYSSAALRERLYVSENPDKPMAGLLIYTADGDSDGTMGGLVRMGKPKHLEPVIRRALEGASWCSADPVCMEMGHSNGQGPDSCNLAACHNCALVPETACEEFNRFLDRALVVGEPENSAIGFFDTLLNATA